MFSPAEQHHALHGGAINWTSSLTTAATAPPHNKQQSHLVAPPDKCNRGGRGNVKTSKKGTRIQRRKLAGSLIGWTLETRSTSAGRRYSIWHSPSGMKSCRSKAEAERVVAEESLIGMHG